MKIEINRYAVDEEGGGRPIGMPNTDRIIPITQSELGQWQCPRRGLLRDTLKGRSTSAQRLGNLWHMVAEDLYRWWMIHDQPYPEGNLLHCGWCSGSGWECLDTGERHACASCRGTGLGPVALAREEIHDLAEVYEPGGRGISAEEAEEMAEKLHRMADGYLQRWHGRPLQSVQIVAVEHTLVRPILNPMNGLPLTTSTWLQRSLDGGPWSLAEPGAAYRKDLEIREVRWPWVLLGRADAIGRDRDSHTGWLIDSKSSAAPNKFGDKLLLDPQLPLYAWAASSPSIAASLGLSEVRGYMYDVVSTSNQPDPKRLKWKAPLLEELKGLAQERALEVKGRKVDDYLDALGIERQEWGEFSVSESTNGSVPSWRFERAVLRAGLSLEPYQDFLDFLYQHTDQRLYQRPYTTFGEVDMRRISAELYGRARLIASYRRAAVFSRDATGLDVNVPRVPVCMSPGTGCDFTPICIQDDPAVRNESYDYQPTVQWWE